MASSFPDQIPVIINLFQILQPRTVLDVGKGFGKYGFLIHEYVGVSSSTAPDPAQTLVQQSDVAVDAVEVQERYLWPHIDQLYRRTFVGKNEDLYSTLPHYHDVLMADVIEHIDKKIGCTILRHFLEANSTVIVSTPKEYFDQKLYASQYEQHVSHWMPRDFGFSGFMDYQNCGAGRIYLLSATPRALRGFGNRPLTRLRRVARTLLCELW
jgi:hypothetical protein